MQFEEITSNFSSLVMLVLKDIRLERGIPQGLIAQHIGKTPSAWVKLENGQARFTMDAFCGVCMALQLNPSYIMSIVERIMVNFNQAGWFFLSVEDPEQKVDKLLELMDKYYNSPGYKRQSKLLRVNILEAFSNIWGNLTPSLVQYCCDESYRKEFDTDSSRTNILP